MKPKKAVRAKARKPKLEPWRAELARIVKFLNKDEENSGKLWLVLSALRGPDFSEGGSVSKKAITGVFRNQIGLVPLHNAYVNLIDCEDFVDTRQNHTYSNGHFYYHARAAFEVCGLKWDKLNS